MVWRRKRLCGLLLGLLAAASLQMPSAPAWAGDWPRTTPAETGFAPDLGERLDAGVESGRFDNLHTVLIARGGKLVLERYYSGEDQIWGRPQGRVDFDQDTLHDLRSVTKSIVGLLYGIALAEGAVPPLDARLVDQFPNYPELADAPLRRRMTVAHALTMTLGTRWNEGLPYSDPRNSEHAMELADDRYRFVLSQPMVQEPGARWAYNGGATAVLAHLIAEGTGRPLHAYAEEKLFRPLGITAYEWIRGRDGVDIAASGLRLRARDLAKIGQLVLQRGRWEDRQLVPADWLKASFQAHADAESEELQYGYHWWLGPRTPRGPLWIGAFGNGGQRLQLLPGLDLVVVIFAGNYDAPEHWRLPVAVITEVVLPSLPQR